jgi:hypothetical protein
MITCGSSMVNALSFAAVYRYALGEPVKCMNLIVNSVEPSAPIEHVWTDDDMETGWRAFMAAYQLWVIEKGYEPGAEYETTNIQHSTSNIQRGGS